MLKLLRYARINLPIISALPHTSPMHVNLRDRRGAREKTEWNVGQH